MFQRCTFAGVLLLAAAGAFAQTQPAAPGFETDFLNVMHIMKSPAATGVLVADVTHDGPAEKGGMAVGDIITSYGGTGVETIRGLRQCLADAQAARTQDETLSSKIELKVFRAGKTLNLIVERGGLEVTPVEVRAGVACTLNPPPTPKEDLHLEWDALMPPAKGDAALQPARREYLVMKARDETVTAFMQRTLSRDGAVLESEMKVCTRDNPEEAALQITVRFAPSSGVEVPPFLLDTMTYDNPLVHLKVQRQGTRLVERGAKDAVGPAVTPTVMGVIPLECGIEALAAAMPQAEGKVVGFAGLDPYSLQTRPGYALVTVGRKKMTINKQELQLWGVQGMRFGQVEMTWWFDDQRRLTLIEGPDLRAERVATEEVARAMLKGAGQ